MAWFILGGLLLAFFALCYLTPGCFDDEAAALIEDAAAGTVDAHDWDDFLTCPGKAPEREALRKECQAIDQEHCSDAAHTFVTEEGAQLLRRVAARLRGGN